MVLLKSEGRLSQKVSSLLVYLSPVYVFQTIYICEKLSRRLSSSRRSCSGNLPNCLCEVRPAYRKSKSSRLAYKHAEIYNLQHSHIIGVGNGFRTLLIMFFISNEGISILENAGQAGIPVPKKFQDIIYKLKDRH